MYTSKKTGNSLVIHYPLLSQKFRKEGDKRALCGDKLREDKRVNGTYTVHLSSNIPDEINCKECKRLVKGSGLIKYENASENPF